jgi:hypothetical protein
MTNTTEPPIPIVPPFVLPDRAGKPYNTARWRGRRYGILLFLAPEDVDAPEYLQSFAARQAEFAWLHTEIAVVIPTMEKAAILPALPFPILRDDGQVRARVLPGVAPAVMALMVTDLSGQVAMWRTARQVASLPDVETALGWAWEVARPRGSCGGVTWSVTAEPEPQRTPPAPIGRFTIGAHPHHRYRQRNTT